MCSAQAAARQQFTIDILDVWIPATGAGLAHLNEGTLGIFGFVLFSLVHGLELTKLLQSHHIHSRYTSTVEGCEPEVDLYVIL